jgi:hypothetical protein
MLGGALGVPTDWVIAGVDGAIESTVSESDFHVPSGVPGAGSSLPDEFNSSFSPNGQQRVWQLLSEDLESHYVVTHVADLPSSDTSPLIRDIECSLAADGYMFLGWSPDSTRILVSTYPSRRPAGTTLYVANADGTGLRQVTAKGEGSYDAAWSPDSELIAYQTWWADKDSDRNADTQLSNPRLYAVRADGSDKRRLLGDDYRLEAGTGIQW